MRSQHLGVGTAAAVLLASPLTALASLGGTVSTVQSDGAHMKAGVQVARRGAYEVHTIQAPSGTVVDEYVSPQGRVFAVSWHGPFPPPMQDILGTYFQQYSAALQAQPRPYGHRPLHIQEQNLVVETGGHVRAHFGRAYVPGLVPAGVTVQEIQ